MDIKSLYAIYKECGGKVTTDTRTLKGGELFFALKGENFDGNEYASKALEAGAGYAVVNASSAAARLAETDSRIIPVEDTLKTLQALARWHRSVTFVDGKPLTVIALTGTNGKTTTKELIREVLSTKYNVTATEGNLNNNIGVPLTLLKINSKTQIAVVEMGASHPGDIKTLVDIVEPDCGIITNVGRAHLQGFGSFEGVVKTKGELYDFLRTRPDSVVFIHNDNDHLLGIAHDLKLVRYGCKASPDLYVYGQVTECAPFLNFEWRHLDGPMHTVHTHLIGSYNIYNMLAAATIGLWFGVSEEQVCHALTSYVPSNNRSELVVTAHNRLIVDAYNANPTSMKAALENFRDMRADHKMCILGMMGELGDVSREEHQKVVSFLEAAGFEEVWLVGSEFEAVNPPFRTFHDVDEVKAAIAEDQPVGRTILVKGSNSTKLFQLPDLL